MPEQSVEASEVGWQGVACPACMQWAESVCGAGLAGLAGLELVGGSKPEMNDLNQWLWFC